jgi:hypothetical protein
MKYLFFSIYSYLSKIRFGKIHILAVTCIAILTLLTGFQPTGRAEAALPEEFIRLSQEKGLSLEIFQVNGSTGFIMDPQVPAPGKPWVWYAPVVARQPKGENLWMFERLLENGISVAGIQLGEVRGAPGSTARFTDLYNTMILRGFSSKPVLLGQSRGGLMMLAWAVRHPDKLKAFAGIFPVCNLASWPLKRSRDKVLEDYGLPEAELLENLSLYNPVDNLEGLIRRKIPVFIVHGDDDKVVPYDENSGILKERFEAGGAPVMVKIIQGEGHHVSPSFFECRELLDFIVNEALY